MIELFSFVVICGIVWLRMCVFWELFIISIWIGFLCLVKCCCGNGSVNILVCIGLFIIFVLGKVFGNVCIILVVIFVSYLLVKFVILFCLWSIIGMFNDYVVRLFGFDM